MKPLIAILSACLWSACVSAADLSQTVADVSKYESGAGAEPMRQIERAVRESAGDAAQRAEVEAALVKLIAPSSTFEARRFACTQLAIIGTDSSLAAIAQLVGNPETTGIACLALSSNPSPKVNELLRAALSESKGLARVQIVVMLGDREDDTAVKSLCELAHSTDAATAGAAIGSLGKIASRDALKELESLRKTGDPAMAYIVAMASLTAADNAARRGDRSATAIFEELLAASQPVNVRRAAFQGLLRTDADGGEQRSFNALGEADAALKTSAIVQVRRLKSPDASEKFAKRMPSLTPSEQVQMIESLAARNDASGRAAIAGQMTAADASVRRASVVAFAGFGDAGSVPMLAGALAKTANPGEQQAIELALASLKGGETVDEAINALLKNDFSAPKAGLINALARRGSKTSVPALLATATSPETAVARAAFRALGKLARAGDLAAMLDRLAGLKAPDARGDAESALMQILGLVDGADRRFDAVSGALAKAQDVETRCSLLRLLPACGGSQALAAAKAARAEQDARVRETAFRALTEWPDPSAIDALLEIAQTATQNTERALALRGSVRLLGLASDDAAVEITPFFKKAMSAAKSNDDKKLVLGGLAAVHDPVAMDLIKPFLNDPAVRAEAAQAAVSLAPFVCGVARAETRSALQTVMDQSMDKNLIQTARDLAETMAKFDDYIMAWQVTEPYFQDGKDGKALFDIEFPPEQPGANNVKWRLMPAGGLKARPWQLDLGKLYGGDNRTAYVRAWVHSEMQQPARLEFGCDDGLKVWLNGKGVIAANRGGDVVPGAEKAVVTLQQGSNVLLLKVTQWTSGWGFCARVATPDGSPIPGVRIELNPSK
jgi:HEAT repeat protein